MSLVLGPGIGAIIARLVSIEWVFAFDALTSLVAVGLMAAVKVRRPKRSPGRPASAWAELKEGLAFTYVRRPLRYYVLMGTAVWLGFGAFGALEPLFYRDVLEMGVETIGWVNTIFGLGLVAGAALLVRLPRKVVSARGLAIASALTGLGALMYVGTRDIRVVALGALVWGAIIGATDPLLRTLIQTDSPDEYVGRIAGVSQMHRQAGELVPLMIAPALAGAFGVQAVLIGGGLVLSAVAIASWFEARGVDRTILRRREVPMGLTSADEPISPNP